MIRKVYTIFDSASRIYLPPFHCHAHGEAARAFKDAANSKSHYVGQHPADYTLFHTGHFDDTSGRYVMLDAFENLGNAVEFLESAEDPAQPQLPLNNGGDQSFVTHN